MMSMSLDHIYMGTIGMEGTYRTMRDGYIDEVWTKEHHELRYDDVEAGKILAQRSQPPTSLAPNEQPARS